MGLFRSLGHTAGTAFRSTRAVLRGTAHSGRWAGHKVLQVRHRGAGGEPGMSRLFDLHAASCAGDTLITIGLAGTIFFSAPLGEARSSVALYLLVTMVPFALLAPVVGPVLDHFRHGRRYALATTMLGRAFLAWLIADHLNGFGLYPAAFGVLALSRAYGVGRSAAVPRLLPAGLGLSQAGARASVYGTIAGALVAPLGLAAFWFGPQWPLRVASVIFLVGMVIALRLPPRADSEPAERVPRAFRVFGLRRGTDRQRILTGSRLVLATLVGSGTLRCLYGFLLLFLAFAIKAGDLSTVVVGQQLGDEGALGLVGAALAAGSFAATAIGSRMRINRPLALQSSGLVIVAGVGVLATLQFSLLMVALFCFVTAIISGIAKLAVDATIQERLPERLRASAFAHSETILMLSFVAGGAFGLIPVDGRVGLVAAAGFGVLAAARAVIVAGRQRKDRLNGRPVDTVDDTPDPSGPDRPEPGTAGSESADAGTPESGSTDAGAAEPATVVPPRARRSIVPARIRPRPRPAPPTPAAPAPVGAGQGGTGQVGTEPVGVPAGGAPAGHRDDGQADDDDPTPPGFHIYRPSSTLRRTAEDDRPDGPNAGL
ncbi:MULTISPECIES: MFS transporter [unclassified Solwaraspora]|uniref:MFS transporter n=1 Tax=unclassified Solwaraspora TaxID=2627926 RepID=UPI00248AB082|nr:MULTISPECIES: MFS transporter [unclassified Solwaraspora]WBB96490.1 MFS transporter [Solwaraspora sp. WMMA2059]WBC19604.1 MFS transporter [Solwaraspora sp. WMMA2080]WJK32818.1 MFS transporter [Solwaraspora sp. WMMA2065]